jgi:hypothetical protein
VQIKAANVQKNSECANRIFGIVSIFDVDDALCDTFSRIYNVLILGDFCDEFQR